MRCDGSPDPTIPGEINTYLNCQREENDGLTFDQVLQDSTLILSVSHSESESESESESSVLAST